MINKAFDDGARRFPWWPDWQGQCVAIIASGESTKNSGVERTRDRINVLAIKKNADIAPWAEVCYGCDEAFWKLNKGLPDFRGVKLAHASTLAKLFPDIRKVEIKDKDAILLDEPLTVGSGGNSGFQAINLAVQFGATSLALVGFDLNGQHWYGRNPLPMNNPAESNFKRWLRGFNAIAKPLESMGIEVVNCSPVSRISCWPKQTLDQTLEAWGL